MKLLVTLLIILWAIMLMHDVFVMLIRLLNKRSE